MANQEHINILKRGVAVWNRWRRVNPEIRPNFYETDLCGIDLHVPSSQPPRQYAVFHYVFVIEGSEGPPGLNLSCADMAGANLTGANLMGANLAGVDLSGANLTGANLSCAYLCGANLMGADLTEAIFKWAELRILYFGTASMISFPGEKTTTWTGLTDFGRANLSKASFFGANLRGANFSNAHLNETDFSHSIMGETIFGNTDLRFAKGLDTIQHVDASFVSISTLSRSMGEIPEVFLRGVGLPDDLIKYTRSLIGKPFDYYTCFISYSRQNEDFAKRLHADLQENGVRCWFAPQDLKIGDHYHQRIDESIHLYDKLVLILSEHAIQSAWVEREVVAAREKEDFKQRPVLFPLRLDDAVISTTKAWAADVRRRWHIGDFTQWKSHDTYQQAFERLLRDLKKADEPQNQGTKP